MGRTKSTLKSVNNSAELLSYIINQTPILKENIDLPVQGESIDTIGKIIMKNERYKNAFIETVNLIGMTVITKNYWDNPWESFTEKGTLDYGDSIREIITDIANVYDYNEMLKIEDDFIKTVVPNVMSYIHVLNFQKFYKVTTSDSQMAMAFKNDDLFSLIDDIIASMYEGLKYDKFITEKYILQRRIVDGTITAVQIPDFATATNREIVSFVKGISNKMTFRSPNYNPAGIRKATSFDDQIAIVSSMFDGKFTTETMATSYFRDMADMKARYALIDDFGDVDTNRLNELFAKRDTNGDIISGEYVGGYVPFTSAELTALKTIPCVVVGRDFFQVYAYAFDNGRPEKVTEFYNPQTLKDNHYLHYWGVMSASPFENAVVFVTGAPSITSVSVSPSTANMYPGTSTKLSATVVTANFANKAVVWSSSDSDSVKVDQDGNVTVLADADAGDYTITATSVYDSTKSDTCTITIPSDEVVTPGE